MKPGRELDALVAEKVMGLLASNYPYAYPHYSTDIAAAWEVVELMNKRMDDATMFNDMGFNWQGPLYKSQNKYLTAQGYPLGTLAGL